MKNNLKLFLSIAGLFFLSLSLTAQEETEETANNDRVQTLFGNKEKNRSNGGYGGFSTAYTKMDGRDAIMFGGQGGWIIDHGFVLGGAGYGFMTDRFFDAELNNQYMLAGGYGGLLLEFIVAPKSPVHLSIPLVIGGGGVSYTRNNYDYDYYGYSEDSQAFFVIEPGVELELNIVRFMRIAAGAKYRFTSDVSLRYFDSGNRIMDADALNGFSTHITFKFGKF